MFTSSCYPNFLFLYLLLLLPSPQSRHPSMVQPSTHPGVTNITTWTLVGVGIFSPAHCTYALLFAFPHCQHLPPTPAIPALFPLPCLPAALPHTCLFLYAAACLLTSATCCQLPCLPAAHPHLLAPFPTHARYTMPAHCMAFTFPPHLLPSGCLHACLPPHPHLTPPCT